MSLVPVLVGGAFGFGVVLFLLGLRAAEPLPVRESRRIPTEVVERFGLQVAIAVAVSVVAFLLTGWLVGGMLASLGAVSLPRLMRGKRDRAAGVAKTEAVAAWAEMLRDTMAAAAGLEEAIASTAPVAPAPIREPVRRLAHRLAHDRLVPALRAFAEELADPTADLVVTALVLSAEKQARDLGSLLGALARSARMEAGMALRIEAGRARLRTAVRVVTLFTVGFALGMVVLNRAYLEPYDTALGQMVLLLVGGCFAAALHQLQRMSRLASPPRLLAGRPAETRSA